MDAGFAGDEPDLATKAVFSEAGYARDWIGEYAQLLAASGVDVSASVGKMADTYPEASPVIAAIWKNTPQISPQGAYDQRLAEQTGVSPTAQSNVTTVASSAAAPGILTGAITKAGGMISSTGAIMAAIAAIALLGLYLVFRGKRP